MKPYAEILSDETTDGDEVFIARHPVYKGCMSQGGTPEEAVGEFRDACEVYFGETITAGTSIYQYDILC